MDCTELIHSIDATIANLGQGELDDVQRQGLLAASRRLQAATESPLDSLLIIVLGVRQKARVELFLFKL